MAALRSVLSWVRGIPDNVSSLFLVFTESSKVGLLQFGVFKGVLQLANDIPVIGGFERNGSEKMISSKKKIAAVALTAVALSLGALNGASASHAKPKSEASKIEHKTEHKAKHEARQALVASVIALDAATIKSRLKAGESLGAIAGAKKSDVIAALVAEHTKKIDAALTAGKISAAQASTKKSELTAHVTARVDGVRGEGRGEGGHKDHKKHGKGAKG